MLANEFLIRKKYEQAFLVSYLKNEINHGQRVVHNRIKIFLFLIVSSRIIGKYASLLLNAPIFTIVF